MALITCPICKSKISTEATTCPTCGYKLNPKSLCPECANIVEPEDTHCKVCGYPLAKNSEASQTSTAQGQNVIVTEPSKVLTKNKKIILIAFAVVLILVAVISVSCSGSSKNNPAFDISGEWGTYMSISTDGTVINYSDLSAENFNSLYMALTFDSDDTYEMELQGTKIAGEWEIDSDGKIYLYCNGEILPDSDFTYNPNVDEIVFNLSGHRYLFARI